MTIVHYGTTWDDRMLLEQVKQFNLEAERRDGVRRHFRYDWQEVARYNPAYGAYVESERQRLGEDHPLFRTQYRLLTISGGGGLLTAAQLAQIQGQHPRQRQPSPGRVYVAGIDIAGEAEGSSSVAVPTPLSRRDSTVVTIAEVEIPAGDLLKQPMARVVDHRSWTGTPHAELYQSVMDMLRMWKPSRVLVDATGIGEPVASLLRRAAGPRVEPFKFTQASKSELGFELLAAINRGGLKVYAQDGSPENRELMFELEHARSTFRANQTMDFFVDPSQGHDDFLMSLALATQAAAQARPAAARGGVRG